MADQNQTSELLLVVGGSIAAAFSGFVVLTGLVFSKTMLSRTHPFSNIIFFISLCDFVGSIANTIGFPDSDSVSCRAQSFMLFFFFPAAWLWTSALVYQLRSMMLYKKLHISMFTVHCVCWSLALCVAMLPLTEDTYGQDDDLAGRSVCILASHDKRRKYQWMFVLFYGMLIICITLMTFWMLQAAYNIRAKRATAFTDYKEIKIYKATRWYPIALLATWSVSFIAAMLLAADHHVAVSLIQAGQILRTQYGTLLAVIFFANSRIVRHRWKELFYPYLNKNLSTATDQPRPTQFSEDLMDPEGEKFSDTGSFSEGPRFSDLTNIFLQFAGRGNTNASNDDISLQSSNPRLSNDVERGSKDLPRTSFFVRDWLVSKSRANSALEVELQMQNSSGGVGGVSSNNSISMTHSPLTCALEKARLERKVTSTPNNTANTTPTHTTHNTPIQTANNSSASPSTAARKVITNTIKSGNNRINIAHVEDAFTVEI